MITTSTLDKASYHAFLLLFLLHFEMKWGIDSSVWQSPSSPYTNLTNQQMINVFYNVFGEKYWNKLETAALGWLVNNRGALYSGAAIENLPALTAEEKSALIAEVNKNR